MVNAKDAVAAGMADKIGTLDECLASVMGKPSTVSRQAAVQVRVQQAANKVEVTVGDTGSTTTSETVVVEIEDPQRPAPVKNDLEVRSRRQRLISR
jgi:hypothetical protein